MILPTKTIKPVDSLISISAFIIEILNYKGMNIDKLLEEFNKKYYKEISIEKMMLAIDFLYITDSIKYNNEIIKINV
ncbi:ABC-three component system middle component 6 [Tenacibaculum piscium]|uniref:ABC-three component system middle component 6 n=1 Tax=Tenacibaculum piscium TaxID=1458515 RepID=UPI001F1D1C60|nr:ABC-three component system middle component 6 [Tenacibaculum piscium]